MKLFGDRRDRRRLPLYRLTETVLFPGVSVPLVVRDADAQAAITFALENGRHLVTVPVEADGVPAEGQFATLGHIHHSARTPDGALRIVVEGRSRVTIASVETNDRIMTAEVDEVSPDRADPEHDLPTLVAAIRETVREFQQLHPAIANRTADRILSADGADRLVDLAAGNLPIDRSARLEILSETATVPRVRRLADALQHHVELLSVKRSIRDRVRKRLESGQKEYFLQEQIKEINRELGRDGDDDPLAELEQRITDADLPDDVRRRCEREFRRLRKLPPVSPESGIIQTYVEWLISLPWHAASELPQLSIRDARTVLDTDHYGMTTVKERLLEFMAVRALNPDAKGPILCLVGPPGTGKTSLGRSVARALQREFVRLSLGGIRDEAEIRGHRRTYIGALPGRIVQSIHRAGTRNPVVLLDEIDKIGTDFRGDPASALLEVLDPEQNRSFSDHYVELPFDLSQVVFLTTANDLAGIPAALRDRLEVIRIPGYTEDEKIEIARGFLVPEQLRENGQDEDAYRFRSDALSTLISDYTQESGVRSLKRQVATVIRKLILEDAESTSDARQRMITAGTVRRLLGPPQRRESIGDAVARPGLARGLAWTETGGVVLTVEAVRYPGTGQLVITGNLGDVMKESARIAVSVARAHAAALEIGEWGHHDDVHIHVPEGAVPKDGPSAGITILVAVVSLLTGRIADPTVAMTGEVTLTGRVLAVGGIREKLLAARRAKITTVVVPEANRPDIDQLPRAVRSGIELVFASTVAEVFTGVFGVADGDSGSLTAGGPVSANRTNTGPGPAIQL